MIARGKMVISPSMPVVQSIVIFTHCVLPVREIGIKAKHYLIFLERLMISMLSKYVGVSSSIPA